MPKTSAKRPTAQAAAPVEVPSIVRYDSLLDRLTEKDRATLNRQADALAEKYGRQHGVIWKRMTRVLATLAPQFLRVLAPNGIQFFIPDGKYRMQVFALHTPPATGKIAIYLPDVIAGSISAGVLARPSAEAEESNEMRIGKTTETIHIDALDANTPDPDPVFTNMTGWNRKAMRITLSDNATEGQLEAVARLCTLAARSWAQAARETTPAGN